ncbi:MAG TPA: hypothetical protein PKD60_09170, partial [Turneriella sp.]|nr:hypothetical protein [Turneriella sp.]
MQADSAGAAGQKAFSKLASLNPCTGDQQAQGKKTYAMSACSIATNSLHYIQEELCLKNTTTSTTSSRNTATS